MDSPQLMLELVKLRPAAALHKPKWSSCPPQEPLAAPLRDGATPTSSGAASTSTSTSAASSATSSAASASSLSSRRSDTKRSDAWVAPSELFPPAALPLWVPRAICVDEHAKASLPAALAHEPLVHVVRDPLEVSRAMGGGGRWWVAVGGR